MNHMSADCKKWELQTQNTIPAPQYICELQLRFSGRLFRLKIPYQPLDPPVIWLITVLEELILILISNAPIWYTEFLSTPGATSWNWSDENLTCWIYINIAYFLKATRLSKDFHVFFIPTSHQSRQFLSALQRPRCWQMNKQWWQEKLSYNREKPWAAPGSYGGQIRLQTTLATTFVVLRRGSTSC